MTTTDQAQANIAKLAGEEKPCPCFQRIPQTTCGACWNNGDSGIYKHADDTSCDPCKGTGTVARFPGFRTSIHQHSENCGYYHGLCRDPDKAKGDRTATLSEVKARLDNILVAYNIGVDKRGRGTWIARIMASQWGWEDGDSPTEAVIAALVAMGEVE